ESDERKLESAALPKRNHLKGETGRHAVFYGDIDLNTIAAAVSQSKGVVLHTSYHGGTTLPDGRFDPDSVTRSINPAYTGMWSSAVGMFQSGGQRWITMSDRDPS